MQALTRSRGPFHRLRPLVANEKKKSVIEETFDSINEAAKEGRDYFSDGFELFNERVSDSVNSTSTMAASVLTPYQKASDDFISHSYTGL